MAAIVAAAVAGALLAAHALLRTRPAPTIVGSSTTEYTPTVPAVTPPALPGVAWGTYGYDRERTRAVAIAGLRPPFRRLWTFHGRSLLEFPPVLGYGRVYLTTF